jgi:hypothetical protein
MKTDARKLTKEAQQNICYQTIYLPAKDLLWVKISDLLGVSPSEGVSVSLDDKSKH